MELSWLAQLGITGAAALVQAAATEAWQLARSGFTRLLGGDDQGRVAAIERRLDALAAEVEQVPPQQRDEIRQQLLPAWQTRLADLLEEDPAAADALRNLRDELLAQLPSQRQQWVQNVTAAAAGATAQGVMFGNIINHPGLPAADPPAGARGEAPPR